MLLCNDSCLNILVYAVGFQNGCILSKHTRLRLEEIKRVCQISVHEPLERKLPKPFLPTIKEVSVALYFVVVVFNKSMTKCSNHKFMMQVEQLVVRVDIRQHTQSVVNTHHHCFMCSINLHIPSFCPHEHIHFHSDSETFDGSQLQATYVQLTNG